MKRLLLLLCLLLAQFAEADQSSTAVSLTRAAREGDLQTLEQLLSSGVEPNLTDYYDHTPLYYAVAFNHREAVVRLLKAHADPNAQAATHSRALEMPVTALQYAAELGNQPIASLLIAAGARINERGLTGRTALHYAVGHVDVARLLIDAGADVNARDADGVSPLDEAVWYGLADTAAVLVAHGAHVNESEPRTGATPINEAAFKGQAQVVRVLLAAEADLQIPDKHGYVPLDNAVRMGQEESALLMLAADPKQAAKSANQLRLLRLAIHKDEALVTEKLLEMGASANAPLASGATPLDEAVLEGASRVVTVLLDHNADPNAHLANGGFPLEDASLKGSVPLVDALLNRGASANEVDGATGTTALYSAAAFGNADVVQSLLRQGASPNLCGSNGKTPYRAATENGFMDIAADIKNAGGADHCQASH